MFVLQPRACVFDMLKVGLHDCILGLVMDLRNYLSEILQFLEMNSSSSC